MNYLSVEKLSKSFSENVLFEDITFGIEKGRKTALVGVNGSGKSTLLRILMNEEPSDSGIFNFNKSIKIGFLMQEPNVDSHQLVIDYVLSGESELIRTVRNYYHFLEEKSKEGDNQLLLEKMSQLNAWDFESKAKQVLGKLGIHDLLLPIDQLSGGQKKRVALAQVLLEEPDMLILDEPTNHLDLRAIEWLEDYLAKLKISLLLVTHDRYFLQAVTNEIIEIDNGQLHKYSGNYAQFLEKRMERQATEKEQAGKARSLLKKEIEWLNRQPKARGTKAKFRIDSIGHLKKAANLNKAKSKMEISLSGQRLGKKILEVKNLSKQFDSKQIIESFSYTFERSDKIGIVGENGIGKSTFLNLITSAISPDSGSIIKGETVSYGYYHQSGIRFDDQQRVIEAIKEIAEVIKLKDNSEVTASQLLTQFHFDPPKQYDYIKNLSGGEKRRLQLLKVLMGNPNFLILDEPTNDLDLETLNTLEEYLENFDGCIIIVSHDRYFMDRLVDHIFSFEGNGITKDYPGNYTDFRETLKNNVSISVPKEIQKTKKIKTTSSKPGFSQKRELAEIEKKLETLEQDKLLLMESINSGENDFEKLTKWGTKLKELELEISSNEERWLELGEDE